MSSFFVSDVESSSAEDDDFFDEHPNSVFQYIDEYNVSESESLVSESSIKAEAVQSKKSFFLQEPESEEEEEGSRAVLSSSKKFLFEVTQSCDGIKSSVTSSKWSVVHKDFEHLLRGLLISMSKLECQEHFYVYSCFLSSPFLVSPHQSSKKWMDSISVPLILLGKRSKRFSHPLRI